MAGCGARGFFGILPIVDPHVVRKTVSTGAAGHKLPDTASAHSRDSQGVESRLGLREVDQILGNAFLL